MVTGIGCSPSLAFLFFLDWQRLSALFYFIRSVITAHAHSSPEETSLTDGQSSDNIGFHELGTDWIVLRAAVILRMSLQLYSDTSQGHRVYKSKELMHYQPLTYLLFKGGEFKKREGWKDEESQIENTQWETKIAGWDNIQSVCGCVKKEKREKKKELYRAPPTFLNWWSIITLWGLTSRCIIPILWQ